MGARPPASSPAIRRCRPLSVRSRLQQHARCRSSSPARPVPARKARRATPMRSGRKGAFIPVNCAALPEACEAELFGYADGAFTGRGAAAQLDSSRSRRRDAVPRRDRRHASRAASRASPSPVTTEPCAPLGASEPRSMSSWSPLRTLASTRPLPRGASAPTCCIASIPWR